MSPSTKATPNPNPPPLRVRLARRLKLLRGVLVDLPRRLEIAWGVLQSEWRETPPTPEEIRAHADKHPMWGPSALWMVLLPTDQTVMVEYVYLGSYSPEHDVKAIADLVAQGAHLWRPCRLTGEPCRLEKARPVT